MSVPSSTTQVFASRWWEDGPKGWAIYPSWTFSFLYCCVYKVELWEGKKLCLHRTREQLSRSNPNPNPSPNPKLMIISVLRFALYLWKQNRGLTLRRCSDICRRSVLLKIFLSFHNATDDQWEWSSPNFTWSRSMLDGTLRYSNWIDEAQERSCPNY